MDAVRFMSSLEVMSDISTPSGGDGTSSQSRSRIRYTKIEQERKSLGQSEIVQGISGSAVAAAKSTGGAGCRRSSGRRA